MTKYNKKSFIIISLLLSSILVFSGCTTAQRRPVPNQPQNQSGGIQSNGSQRLSTSGGTTAGSTTQRASTITRELISLGNIRRAPVVIDGNTAIVGVQLIDSSRAALDRMAKKLQGATGTTRTGTAAPGAAGTTTGMTGGTTGAGTTTGGTTTGGTNGLTRGATGGTVGGAVGGALVGGAVGGPAGAAIGGVGGAALGGATQKAANNTAQRSTNTNPNGARMTTTPSMDIHTIVAERVKAVDPAITRVLVTTDNSIVTRLQRISTTVQTEISDIVRRLQPATTGRTGAGATGATTGRTTTGAGTTTGGTATGTTGTPGLGGGVGTTTR